MSDDPHALFDAWLREAETSEPNDPNAMAVASVGADGQPSVRMVLLKGHDADGFVFYTNLESRKGGELLTHPKAALLFHWKSLRRQVRVEGPVAELWGAAADADLATRRRARQRAWASDQSQPLDRRETFEARVEAMRARFADGEVPRPPDWSGFRVVAERIEFWTDRPARLHERRLFTRDGSAGSETAAGGWREGLLYP